MDQEFQLMPEQASTIARDVDRFYIFMNVVSLIMSVGIALVIVYFAVRYRRTSKANRKMGTFLTLPIEITWSLIPFGVVMVMFAWSAKLYYQMRYPPEDAMEIYVVGKQWMWKVQHPEGRWEINELHVPVGRPVVLRMASEDVIHSFFIPAFRVKMDVLPDRYTTVWFTATKPGVYHLFCAEYCGTEHSFMRGQVIAMEPAQFTEWLSGTQDAEPAEVAGQKLFDRHRCDTCHLTQEQARCPPLLGIFGKEIPLADGTTVVADEAYIRESILDPNAKIVAGYEPLMPTYQGQIDETGIFQIIAYIKSMTEEAAEDVMQDETSP